jgi:hypothetical protein
MGDICARDVHRSLSSAQAGLVIGCAGHLLVGRLGSNCRRIETSINEAEHRVVEAHSPNSFVNLSQSNRLARESANRNKCVPCNLISPPCRARRISGYPDMQFHREARAILVVAVRISRTARACQYLCARALHSSNEQTR